MKVYENYVATLVAIATVHEKNSNDISYESPEPILMKFHIQHLYDSYTKLSLKVMTRISRWPPCPNMVKTNQTPSSQESMS